MRGKWGGCRRGNYGTGKGIIGGWVTEGRAWTQLLCLQRWHRSEYTHWIFWSPIWRKGKCFPIPVVLYFLPLLQANLTYLFQHKLGLIAQLIDCYSELNSFMVMHDSAATSPRAMLYLAEEFWLLGSFHGVKGHSSPCPIVSPNNCDGSTWTCSSNIAGASPSWSIQACPPAPHSSSSNMHIFWMNHPHEHI